MIRIIASACSVLLFACALVSTAGTPQQWRAIGPDPSHGGQVENITNREVVGAINAVAICAAFTLAADDVLQRLHVNVAGLGFVAS